jgi:hypothetical protein
MAENQLLLPGLDSARIALRGQEGAKPSVRVCLERNRTGPARPLWSTASSRSASARCIALANSRAPVRGQETSRRMNAGPRIARVERGSAYTPPSNSRCFESVTAENDRQTMRRCARLAGSGAGPRASRDPLLFAWDEGRPASTGPTIARNGSGNPWPWDTFG